MKNILEISTREKEDIKIIDMRGDFTLFADEMVNTAIKPLISAGNTKIVLNFTDVRYINSSGIAIIIGLVTLLSNKGGRFKGYGLTPHFQKVFNMVGLTQYIDLFENEEEATQSLCT